MQRTAYKNMQCCNQKILERKESQPGPKWLLKTKMIIRKKPSYSYKHGKLTLKQI